MKTAINIRFFTVILVSFLLTAQAHAKEVQNNFFVDLLVLKHGKTLEDAEQYFEKVVPIAARHGLVRIHDFSVSSVFSGDAKPDLANLWTMAHADVFKDINADPEYKQMIPIRNRLFDMKKSSMYLLDQP